MSNPAVSPASVDTLQYRRHSYGFNKISSLISHDKKAPAVKDDLPPQSVVTFQNLTFTVQDKKKGSKKLIDGVSLHARSGHLMAVMGPSGSGKSTYLDLCSGRKMSEGGTVSLDGRLVSNKAMREISSFVEQEDALIGVLTVRETITYALKLHLPGADKEFIRNRVNDVITSLGLDSCAEIKIGNPIQRGVSGGQKRRVSVGCSMVCFPRVLFLDEPTSGLDSTSAREVMSAIKVLAEKENMIVIATIHQPSWSTLSHFDDVLLLSEGKTCYEGPVDALDGFLTRYGVVVPKHITPTDAAMDLLNTDFQDSATASVSASPSEKELTSAARLREFYLTEKATNVSSGSRSPDSPPIQGRILEDPRAQYGKVGTLHAMYRHTVILSQRTLQNYSRNLLAYGIRFAMYIGMAVMMALIWIHLGYRAVTLNDRLSVFFYSVAFLAFMSVAGIPSFLEERATFIKERKNGLYGTTPFVLSNSIINVPFLFACSTAFVLIMYWGIGLNPSAAAVFRYIGFLFLAVYAAESQVLLVSAVLPIFVAALAVASFLNGFWMSVGGYFIKAVNLPYFWRVSFHWMDYQTYAFILLSNSDLQGLNFTCDNDYCPYPSTEGTSYVSGEDVLNALQIGGISYGTYSGILIGIIVIYRLLLWFVLVVTGSQCHMPWRSRTKVNQTPA